MIDATARATELLAEPWRWDEVLRALREEGFSKVGSIRATSAVLRIPLAEAKRRVHDSQAWSDRKEADEEFHRSLSEGDEPGSGLREPNAIPWTQVWERVALELSGHTDRGNLSLLTEDSIRWATAVWLQRLGVAQSQLHVEVPTSERWRIDLVVEPGLSAIEFKFPRPPRSGTAPLTQHAGAVLADILRVATLTQYAQRFTVVVLLPVFARHLSGRRDVRLPIDPGTVTTVDATAMSRLPETARRQLPDGIGVYLPIEVRCSAAYSFEVFTLVAYESSYQGHGAA